MLELYHGSKCSILEKRRLLMCHHELDTVQCSAPAGIQQVIGFSPDLFQDGLKTRRDILHAFNVLVPPQLGELRAQAHELIFKTLFGV